MHGRQKALALKAVSREIVRLAWPAIATNVTTPLLSLADVAIVGHIGSAVYIGAIAVGGALFNMVYWLFGFLRMGTSGLTAQACGAGDDGMALRTLARSLAIALTAGIVIVACAGWVASIFIPLMDADDACSAPAQLYVVTAAFGAPAVLGTYTLSGWFLGMQSSKPIMWMALIANSANIVLSLVFVFVCHWSIQGVAAGTAIAQWISLIIGLLLLRRRLAPMVKTGWRRGLWAWRAVKRLFSVNADIFLRTLCLVTVTLWFTHAGAVNGVDILAANALLMQLFMLFSFFMDGFAFAGEAMAGRFYGAGDHNSLRITVKALLRIGVAISVVFTILYFFAGEAILGLLTNDLHVLATAGDYRLWAVTVPLAGFMAFVYDGIFIGMTLTRRMLASMAAATAVFFAVWWFLRPAMGNHALWLAFIAYLATRGAVQHILLRLQKLA